MACNITVITKSGVEVKLPNAGNWRWERRDLVIDYPQQNDATKPNLYGTFLDPEGFRVEFV